MTDVPVLYQDEDLVVVNKPAKLMVHRNEWARAQEPFALQLIRDRIGCRVNLVHRLDRATSGLLVCALTPEATAALCAAFAAREVDKTYLAVVRGHPSEGWTEDRPLRGESGAQSAETRFEVTGRATVDAPVGRYATARYALVVAHPRTGRRHQIRRHLSGANHPIVGDVAHGDRQHNRFFRAHFGVDRMLLHARRLRFRHPRDGRELAFEAPLDRAFQAALDGLGWPLGDLQN